MIIAHMGESMFSSFTYVVIAMIVRGADRTFYFNLWINRENEITMTDLDGDFSPEMLSDIAAIFSSGNEVGAISADVPTALKVRKSG